MERVNNFLKRTEIEIAEEWRMWSEKIPYIKFDPDWEVKIIPPVSGAIARFWIRKGDKWVSVYLDCYEVLGLFGEPYWEAYPIKGDTYRCSMNDTDSLLSVIRQELES